MFSAFLQFNSMPKIGFAHHFYADEYSSIYTETKKSFEIVYVQSGGIVAELYGEKLYAPENSVFVLFRHLPFKLSSTDNTPQSHCTVQAEFDYSFTLVNDGDTYPESNGIILPFITLPCPETEIIKKALYSIVSDIGIGRRENSLSCAIQFLDVMRILNKLARKNNMSKTTPASNITYKVKKYIANNINTSISLSDISNELGLTPSYINHIFKDSVGIPIKQYVNKKRHKRFRN